jgi:hypothetical protein
LKLKYAGPGFLLRRNDGLTVDLKRGSGWRLIRHPLPLSPSIKVACHFESRLCGMRNPIKSRPIFSFTRKSRRKSVAFASLFPIKKCSPVYQQLIVYKFVK